MAKHIIQLHSTPSEENLLEMLANGTVCVFRLWITFRFFAILFLITLVVNLLTTITVMLVFEIRAC